MRVKVRVEKNNVEKILKNIIIIIDTREQENKHIIDYLEKKKISYISKKLEFGDYSCMLKAAPELGLPFDISFENTFVVEKKNSLDEIAGNLTNGRTEFENEFIRANLAKCNVNLLIEDGSWEKIANNEYRSNFKPQSFYNSLISFSSKFNIKIHFVSKNLSPYHLLQILGKELRTTLLK